MVTRFRQALSRALLVGGCLLAALASQAAQPVEPPSDWRHLTVEQKRLLAPLSAEWDTLTAVRQRKWLGIANRYPTMASEDQAKLRSRVSAWARLSQSERDAAREQFKKWRTTASDDNRSLHEQWLQYDALPAAEKQRLKQAPRPAQPGNTHAPKHVTQGNARIADKTPVQSPRPTAAPAEPVTVPSAPVNNTPPDTPAATP
ncbi:MAG: DUF3106 domain-containing protein [Rhodocyclaceae bacterium]|jgi:hypothetical protein